MNKFNLGKVRGEDGKSATIAIGTVRTGQPGSNASVTNVGNSINAILDFDIPRGDQGNEAYYAGNNVQISGGVISATDTTYAPATPSADGLMTSADKAKLNGIATGATNNATDAQLRDRATHTGTQAISTVSGLQADLDSKVDKVAGKQLSTEDFTSALKDKLTSLEGTHWRGTFVSLAALQAGVTDPVAGDYADVDAVGADVERYIWDATDGVWVVQSGAVSPITASQVKQLYESNHDTNAFTDAEKGKLGGIQAGAQVNAVTSVNGKTGAVTGLVENTDGRLSDSREWTAATVSQAEAEAGTASTRRAWTAQRVRQAIVAWWNGITSTLGRTLVGRTTAADMRGDLGLGTAATRNVGTDSSSVAAGDHNHTGVYDPAGTAAGQVAEHESTYNHGKFVSGPESAQSGNLVVFDGVTGKMVKDNGFKFSSKQDKLTAGTNITIDENNAVSAKDTTYTAGDNIDITNEVITYVPTFPIMQPNRIDQNVTVPDGYNAVMFGDFEIAPGVTIECVGNANFIALG